MVRGQRTNSRVARVIRGLTGASWIGADVAKLRHICRAAITFCRTVVTGNAAQVVVQQDRICGTGTMRARSVGGRWGEQFGSFAPEVLNKASSDRVLQVTLRKRDRKLAVLCDACKCAYWNVNDQGGYMLFDLSLIHI